MPRRIRRLLLISMCTAALFCVFALGANAYTYPSMPSDWENVQVTVGSVTMPFARYPSGSTYPGSKRYMTVDEQRDYGIYTGGDIDLRGWQCVGFARYVYTALFYTYPQDATIDTSLAYSYAGSYAYRDMIEEVLGTQTLEAGYSASTLKTLFTECRPGAVFRVRGHSMVLMAIYDDGFLIYDANFSNDDEVNVRMYTWQSFVDSLGGRGIEALHMPAYYPGFSYSTGANDYYDIDTSTAGTYVVYDASSLNVRSRPSTSASVVGTLNEGDVVEVYGTYEGWAKIFYNGVGCWVSADYLKQQGKEVPVTFDPNGGRASAATGTFTSGQPFGALPTAQKANRSLVGWTDGSTVYTASSMVPAVESLSLKAQWCVLGYQDVLEEAWYASYVEDAYFKGLISKDSAFNPNQHASRAHMITVLGREYEREHDMTISNDGQTKFEDVPTDSYFAKYVAWGNEVGIVNGVSEREFAPDEDVTREQIAEFLYRLAIYSGLTQRTPADPTVYSRFHDSDEISDYAKSAMCWAVQVGILQGDDTQCVNPGDSALRSEMITMFSRYITYAGSTAKIEITVTFDPDGGQVEPATATYEMGGTMGTLPTPTKEYRTFLGWYDGDTKYTEDTEVPGSAVTLKAKWQVLGYTDVEEDDWFVPVLERSYATGLIDGQGEFQADVNALRREMVTLLGLTYENATGNEVPEPVENPFEDVDLSQEYAKYAIWGKQNGLVKGTDDTHFDPESNVTREQIVTFLYRLAGMSGITNDFVADAEALKRFDDGDDIDESYQEAMCWAIQVGILQGDDTNRLNPHGFATHAELLAMMIRYIDNVAR